MTLRVHIVRQVALSSSSDCRGGAEKSRWHDGWRGMEEDAVVFRQEVKSYVALPNGILSGQTSVKRKA